MTITMHNKFGQIDLAGVSQADVESLSDEQRNAFFACIEAGKAAEAGEIRVRDAERDVYAKMVAYDAALAADALANPAQDRISAMREVIAANRRT